MRGQIGMSLLGRGAGHRIADGSVHRPGPGAGSDHVIIEDDYA